MITKAEQYEYVVGEDVDEAHPHGDLDRIVIDGEIMPLRTGDTGKKDKDGNAISRQKILRGEDITFLMEAVMQRAGRNWLVESYSYRWVYDTSSETWSKEKRINDGTTVGNMVFSRKVRATNFGGRAGPNAKNEIVDLIDGVCDNCINGLSVETKVFVVASDVERPSSNDFHAAYGFSGLPENLRPYKNYDIPKTGSALDMGLLNAYFMTVSALKYAYLGTVSKSGSPMYSVNVDGDTGGYPTDFVIVGMDGDEMHRNEYTRWGVREAKWSEWDDDAQDSKIREGAIYCAVKTGFVFAEFRARHVRNASAVAVLRITWNRYEGDTFVYGENDVWLPVSMEGDGSGVFRLTSTGNFDTKQSVVSLLSRCGWARSSFPPGKTTGLRAEASIVLDTVHVLGEWDDHTSLGA